MGNASASHRRAPHLGLLPRLRTRRVFVCVLHRDRYYAAMPIITRYFVFKR